MSLFDTKEMYLLNVREKLSMILRMPVLIFFETIYHTLENYDPEWIDPLDPTWR